jgi:hypothetical protein
VDTGVIVADKIALDDSQIQRILAAIDALADHSPNWKHLLLTAVPVFLASLLGFGTAYLLDWLKTRRENRKTVRERLEKELEQLSGVNTAIAFNVTVLIHTVEQSIFPHYEKSHAAQAAMSALNAGILGKESFSRLLHTDLQPMLRRCPDPYLEEVNLSKDLSFLLKKDHSLTVS